METGPVCATSADWRSIHQIISPPSNAGREILNTPAPDNGITKKKKFRPARYKIGTMVIIAGVMDNIVKKKEIYRILRNLRCVVARTAPCGNKSAPKNTRGTLSFKEELASTTTLSL
jgi:hypothetical protein